MGVFGTRFSIICCSSSSFSSVMSILSSFILCRTMRVNSQSEIMVSLSFGFNLWLLAIFSLIFFHNLLFGELDTFSSFLGMENMLVIVLLILFHNLLFGELDKMFSSTLLRFEHITRFTSSYSEIDPHVVETYVHVRQSC